jgi:hypothetical protein
MSHGGTEFRFRKINGLEGSFKVWSMLVREKTGLSLEPAFKSTSEVTAQSLTFRHVVG